MNLAKAESIAAPAAAATDPAAPLLKLSHISRHYQSGDTVVRALDDASLTIWPGEFLAIMGQSGSGKSTLMNIIGCLDQPTSGSYQVLGQETSILDADELAALRRHTFGFIFQRYNLLATATATENVEIPAVYAGVSKRERIARARRLLTRLGMGDRSEHRPAQLSGGQQQRVAVARALMNDPPVILADEPTGALDSKSGQEVLGLLRQLHAEGRTIILITHDESIAANAERIIRIRDGRIAETAESAPKTASHHTLHHLDRADGAGLFTEVFESTKTALRALRVNLFRTVLTLLGIIIGVASVVTMLAVGSGSKQKVLDQISAMGTNILSVRPGAAGMRGGGDIITLTPDDGEAIKSVANVAQVTPERGGRQTLRHGDIDYQTTVTGTWAEMPLIRDWPMASGSFFSARDLRSYAPVIVLGQTVVKNLFPDGSDPIGQYVRVKNVPFEVIGVLAAKGATMFGSDQDDAAFVPLTTGLIRLFGRAYVNSITVNVQDVKKIDETQQAITTLLLDRHRTEDFNIRNMSSILDMATETQNTLTILLGAVAAISLLVGGIGVMNIMLVSVTERTREIGLRMATGARRRDIMLQFSTEASVVCTVGGILGVVIGVLAGLVLRSFDIAVIFSVMPALLAFSCAFATGLLFGWLPARKAAHLDPVVALASE
ncbi:MAG TPA: MacB family efflux pump subunit [Gammaproteobacteria bacterium]|nr:MacB family efflux pump subunit [Gammaproteobacteria bacterium]